MKKITTVFAMLFIAIGLHAQEGFKLGLKAGLPFDDFNDELRVVVGLDTGYMWALGKTIDMGLATGIIHGFPETFHTDTTFPSLQFIPVAGAIRIWPSNSFSFGGEVGQAFGLNENKTSGLYLKPTLGYLMGPNTEVNFSYTAIELDEKSLTTISFGVLYTFQNQL